MVDNGSLTKGIELVSHSVRAEILIALAERIQEDPRDQALRFAQLRKRVGHDDPGNFNYHLQRLRGNLVEKRDGGYQLSDVGHHFVAILLSGRFDPDTRLEFPDVKTRCLVCGTSSEITYRDGMLRTMCDDGHSTVLNVGPELLDSHPVSEALNIAFRRTLLEAKSMTDGVCPHCEGATAGTVTREEDKPVSVLYEWVCENCGTFLQHSAGGSVLFHPAVVSFCYRHDVDVFERAWDVMARDVESGGVKSEDPLNVRVAIRLGDDTLVVTLDDTATVVDVARDKEL
jgi:hypothetical protein